MLEQLGDWNEVAAFRLAELDDLTFDLQVRRASDRPPLTDGQRRALHAKLNAVAAAEGVTKVEAKRALLAAASRRFGRELVSANDLSVDEAGILLDELDERLSG